MTEEFVYADLAKLVRWMADNGYTPDQIADAVEKPWHYRQELLAANGDELAAKRVLSDGA